MKLSPTLLTVLSATLFSSTICAATHLASWDDWGGYTSSSFTADDSLTGITATVGITDDRQHGSFGSSDGNFGTSIDGASLTTSGLLVRGEGGNLVLTIDLTNNTGSDYQLTGFYFDFAPREHKGNADKGANEFLLEYDGNTLASQSGLAYVVDEVSGAYSEYPGYDIDLTPSSIDLLDTATVSFTLTFSGGDNASVSSVVDNMLITGTIPEPSAVALLGLGVFGLIARRRR